MTFDNSNRGAVWSNDKEGNPNRPDFKGSLNVKLKPQDGESPEQFIKRLAQGMDFWVSAWKRKPNGNPKAPALSFNIERKEDKYQSSNDQGTKAEFNNDFDEEIPF